MSLVPCLTGPTGDGDPGPADRAWSTCHHVRCVFLFDLGTFWLALLLVAVVGACTFAGIAIGRWLRAQPDANSEPVGVVQGALLGLVGLLLAFGLTMAVGRYEARRAVVVQEANTIGTTYLRAQLAPRADAIDVARSAEAVRRHRGRPGRQVPFTDRFDADVEQLGDCNATCGPGRAAVGPIPPAPARDLCRDPQRDDRAHSERMASLRNRVPTPVMLLQVGGSAIAIGVLAAYSRSSVAAKSRRCSPRRS